MKKKQLREKIAYLEDKIVRLQDENKKLRTANFNYWQLTGKTVSRTERLPITRWPTVHLPDESKVDAQSFLDAIYRDGEDAPELANVILVTKKGNAHLGVMNNDGCISHLNTDNYVARRVDKYTIHLVEVEETDDMILKAIGKLEGDESEIEWKLDTQEVNKDVSVAEFHYRHNGKTFQVNMSDTVSTAKMNNPTLRDSINRIIGKYEERLHDKATGIPTDTSEAELSAMGAFIRELEALLR